MTTIEDSWRKVCRDANHDPDSPFLEPMKRIYFLGFMNGFLESATPAMDAHNQGMHHGMALIEEFNAYGDRTIPKRSLSDELLELIRRRGGDGC